MPTHRRRWAAGEADPDWLASPRDDLIRETPAASRGEQLTFAQHEGPLRRYERTLALAGDGSATETIRYRTGLPWFGWVFAPFVAYTLRHRPRAVGPARQPWWAPPDRLDHTQVLVLGLLAAASMASAFTNTLFTQTIGFAAKTFGADNGAQANAGTVVRLAIVLGLPLAIAADRIGRQRMIRLCAFASPAACALGAVAPSLAVLTATQAVGRTLGLVFDLLIAVMAAEVMPRNARAYAVSVLAMASGLGAGICVMSLRVADVSPEGWRWVYVVTLIWLVVAVDLARRLPETRRFERHAEREALVGREAPTEGAVPAGREAPAEAARERRRHRGRLAAQAAVLFCANMFVAPASFFQNRYLDEVRGYSGGGIALFTLVTQTPAGIGILVGGRIADRYGRRILGAVSMVVGTGLVLVSFAVSGQPMWAVALIGGIISGLAVPALLVYRAEMFPTGKRSLSGYWITATALVSGSIGLQVTGAFLDRGVSHASVLGVLALGQVVASLIVLTRFPETAHRELEEINPADADAVTARTVA